MEDGPDGRSSTALTNNGEIRSVMANFPEAEVEPKSPVVNGKDGAEICSDEHEDSSDCDALVIDETVKPKSSKLFYSNPEPTGFRGFEQVDNYETSNVIHALYKEELSNFVHIKQRLKKQTVHNATTVSVNRKRSKETKKSNPKLREYAQYLGLQPTVQFKCSKCGLSGFPSLISLNEHLIQCKSRSPVTTQPVLTNTHTNVPSTNIRVTRKVYLCSACGTYYENWNLFLHMREVHKRFICLYCLGMFSHSEKLSLHLTSKHNCTPSNIDSLEDFYNIYKDPCFLMCCDCQKVFTERDNFFSHVCPENAKNPPKPVEHVNKQVPEPNAKNELLSHAKFRADSFESFEASLAAMETGKDCNLSNESTLTSSEALERENEELYKDALNKPQPQSEIMRLETDDALDNRNSNTNTNTSTNMDMDMEMEMEAVSPKMSDDENCKPQVESDPEEEGEAEAETEQNNDFPEPAEPEPEPQEEVRKVPKVTLKLPKQITYEEEEEENFSDDSEKLTMEVDLPPDGDQEEGFNVPMHTEEEEEEAKIEDDGIQVGFFSLVRLS